MSYIVVGSTILIPLVIIPLSLKHFSGTKFNRILRGIILSFILSWVYLVIVLVFVLKVQIGPD